MNATATMMSQSARVMPRTEAQREPLQAAQAPLDIEALKALMPLTRRKLVPGQHLYRAGQPFVALYLVHAGFLKTCAVSEDGREQITGFHLRGELLGVDSIGTSTHACDAIALDHCEVWELPYPPVLTACLRIPELQARLASALAGEIRRDRNWMLALGTLDAEQRVAAFLLDLASRYEALGFSPTCFVLRTTRAEMGSFLALKHETVTRALSHLDELGYISVLRREVRIENPDALRRMTGRSARVH
jgi:CRP/FNR family transcriptional regulator